MTMGYFSIGFQCFLLTWLAIVSGYGGDGSMESACAPQVDITRFRCTQARLTEVPLMIHPDTLDLDLSHNRIEILHEDSFSRLRAVRKLVLGHNKIYKLTDLAFVPIASTLRVLDLRNNQLISSETTIFPVPAFAPLSNLVELDLSGNHLAVLPPNLLRSAGSNLKRLRISSCTVRVHIKDNAFSGLNQLTHLDLSYNTFAEVDEQAFGGMRPEQFHVFLIHGSRWTCDCRILWLHHWLRRMSRITHLNISDPVSGECYHPSEVRGQYLMKVSITNLQCAPHLIHTSPSFNKVKDSYPIPVVGFHGFNLTLTCTFISEPKSRVDWFKNGVLITPDWTKIGIDTSFGTKFTTVLYIYDLIHDLDGGVYQCESTNHMGRAWAIFSLQVDKSSGLQIDGLRSAHSPNAYKDISGEGDVSHRTAKYILITSAITAIHVVLIVVCVIAYKCFRGRSGRVKKSRPAGDQRNVHEWRSQQSDSQASTSKNILKGGKSLDHTQQTNWENHSAGLSTDQSLSSPMISNCPDVTPQIEGYGRDFFESNHTNKVNNLHDQTMLPAISATRQPSSTYYTLITRTNQRSRFHELAYSPIANYYAKQRVSPSTSDGDKVDPRQPTISDCSFCQKMAPEGEPTPIERSAHSPTQRNPHAVIETEGVIDSEGIRKCALHPNVDTDVCPIHGLSRFSFRSIDIHVNELQKNSFIGYSNPRLHTFHSDYPKETFTKTKQTPFRGNTLPR